MSPRGARDATEPEVMMLLLCIDLSYACFGAVVDETDRCTRVAPIARWMLGKSAEQITKWVSTKGGTVVRMP